MSEQQSLNIVQSILDNVRKEAEKRESVVTAHDGTQVGIVIAPTGVSVSDTQALADKYASIPRSRAGKVRVYDIDSLAQLILRDRDAGTMVFVDVAGSGCQFEAVLDYHQPIGAPLTPSGSAAGGVPVTAAGSPESRNGQRHGREVIFYDPHLSKEWTAWTKQATQDMTPADFAAWIDEHLPDIADPRHLLEASPKSTAVRFGETYGFFKDSLWGYADPQKMVDLSRGLEIREGCTVKSMVRLESGEVNFTYETEHTDAAGKPLKVPTRFLLSISVFEREAVYLVPVKLSYKKRGPTLTWSFELFRPDRFRDDAIAGMRESLAMKLTPGGATKPEDAKPVVPIHLAKRAG